MGSGTVNLGGGVAAGTLAEYYSYLKRDQKDQGMDQKFYKTSHLGYQRDAYWYLSNEVTSLIVIIY